LTEFSKKTPFGKIKKPRILTHVQTFKGGENFIYVSLLKDAPSIPTLWVNVIGIMNPKADPEQNYLGMGVQ